MLRDCEHESGLGAGADFPLKRTRNRGSEVRKCGQIHFALPAGYTGDLHQLPAIQQSQSGQFCGVVASVIDFCASSTIDKESHIMMKSPSCQTRFVVLCGLIGLVFACGTYGGVVHANEPQAAPQFEKILFLGNSITLHGPSTKIGWEGNWGMAASALEKDYVHIVARSLAKSSGTTPKMLAKNIAAFERQYATYDLKQSLKDAFTFKPDLVVVAIGENVPQLKSAEAKTQFQASVTKLLKQVKSDSNPTIIVRSCFWPDPAKDEALRQACRQAGGIFVDISSLGKDEANYARSERDFMHAGVAAHPGDRGMQAIADAILKALNP